MIEGELLIRDGLKSGGVLKSLIISRELENPKEVLSEIRGDAEIYVLDQSLFQKLSETETGRFVIGEFKIPNWSMEDIKGDILVLDRLQDPGNMGTLIRTSDAAGFGGIIALKGTVDAFSSKVVRSAAGSIMRMPIVYVEGEEELLKVAKSHGYKTVVTTLEKAESYWEADLNEPVALVIGNEGAGVSQSIQEAADIKIKIPMVGEIESLNAGVAGSLAIYETLRQKSRIKQIKKQ